ncbi:MAG: ATP-binding protein [Candidatus Micrarchaeota archaeon]
MYLRTHAILKFWKKQTWRLVWALVAESLLLVLAFYFFGYSNNAFFQIFFAAYAITITGAATSCSIWSSIKAEMKHEPEDNASLLRLINFFIDWNRRNHTIFLGKILTDLMKELRGYSYKRLNTGLKLLVYPEIVLRALGFALAFYIFARFFRFFWLVCILVILPFLLLYLFWACFCILFIFCSKWAYLDPLENSNPHILVSGISGTGKSALLRAMVADIILKMKKPVLVIDYHNEYIDEVSKLGGAVFHMNEISINVFELSDSPRMHISMLTSMIHSIVPLGQIQQFTFENLLYEMYAERGIIEEDPRTWTKTPFTSQDLMERVMERLKASKSKKSQDSLAGLYRRLDTLFGSNIFGSKTDIPFKTIVSKPTVIALANVSNESTQKFLVEMILRRLYFYMLKTEKLRNQIKLFVVLDEAPKIIPNTDASIVNAIAAESRKYNIALILSGQSNILLNKSLIQNSATKIQFFSQEPVDFEYVSKLMAGSFDDNVKSDRRRHKTAEMLRSLNPLQFIYSNTIHKNPIMIKLEPPWKRKYLTKLLDKNLEAPTIEPPKKEPETNENAPLEATIAQTKEEVPNKIAMDVIMRKLQLSNGCMQKTQLLKSMNMSVRLFYEVLQQMKSAGMVEEIELNLTSKKAAIFIVRKVPNKSSLHFATIALIADHLSRRNYGFTIKDGPDTSDLDVDIASERVALEIEMGKKKDKAEILSMLRRRLEKYSRIILVAPQDKTEEFLSMTSQAGFQNKILVMDLEQFFKFFK